MPPKKTESDRALTVPAAVAPTATSLEIDDPWITDAEEKRITTLSKSTRWRLARQGKYPKAVPISPGRAARRRSSVLNYMREREAQAAKATPATETEAPPNQS